MTGPSSGSDSHTDPQEATLAVTPGSEPEAPVTAGTRIGPFVVIEEIGAGGMGRVLRGYDARLRREVALKLVTTRKASSATRVLREAQAMAQLNHPNVIAIYDVGEHAGSVFIAMEYVEGKTLRQWRAQMHPWREVVAVFLEAGEGLAAAHRAGLVHRDFKPANVLLGDDGRTRVLDFGLARSARSLGSHSHPAIAADDPLGSDDSDPLQVDITQAGVALGSPAYMAPEQHRGEAADPRADQYAFCVALYESLYGMRPFSGSTFKEIGRAKVKLAFDERPKDSPAVPRRLHRLVVRGLSPKPGDRWPDMEALLGALRRTTSRTRARLAAAITATAVIGGGSWGYTAWQTQAATQRCETASQQIQQAWPGPDDGARELVRRSLVETAVPEAEATFSLVQPWLDGWTESWTTTRYETCVATSVRQDWDPDTGVRAQQCLEEHRLIFEALISELGQADTRVARNAVAAAAGLDPVERCADPQRLRQRPQLPTDRQTEVAAVVHALSRSRALTLAARYPDALAAATEALSRAKALGWAPLIARARARVGIAYINAGRFDDAREALVEAFAQASKAGATEAATTASTALITLVGRRLAHRDEGLVWGELADIELTRLGATEGLRAASRHSALALVYSAHGEYDDAQLHGQRSLDIREGILGAEHPLVASSLGSLASTERARGRYDDALRMQGRALRIMEAALGPDHPNVAGALNNLATIHRAREDYEEAKVLMRRALDLLRRALGPTHADVATILNNLASMHDALGELEDAQALYERALHIRNEALGPDHPSVASTLNNLGVIQYTRGQYDEAIASFQSAQTIWRKSLDTKHPNFASSYNNLGLVYQASGELTKASQAYAKALTVIEQAMGADHPDAALPRLELGNIARDQGRPRDGLTNLRRALAIRQRSKASPAAMGEVRFALAQTLWDAGMDRAEAVGLARQSLEDFGQAKRVKPTVTKAVEDWLATHEGEADPKPGLDPDPNPN